MPLESFRSRAMLLKLETTEGVDSVPTAALNAFQLFDGSSGVAGDVIERQLDRPFFTNDPFVVANPRAFVQGGFEIVPPAEPGHATNGIAAVDVLLWRPRCAACRAQPCLASGPGCNTCSCRSRCRWRPVK